MPRIVYFLAICCLAAAPTLIAPIPPSAAHQSSHEADQASQTITVPSGPKAVARGEKVFRQNCAICHLADSRDTKVGPGLKGLFQLEKTPALGHPVSVRTIREHIVEGSRNMPSFRHFGPEKLGDLLAYLQTL